MEKIMKKFVIIFALMFFASTMVNSADLRLIEATKKNDIQSVRQLVKEKVNVNEQLPDGATALHWAVHRDDISLVELLIKSGADVNSADQGGATPLWVAVSNDMPDMVARLLKAGANPNATLSSGETPLMTASEIGSMEVVKALLSAKADVNAKESLKGQTALMWSVAEGHADVTNALIDKGASIRDRSNAGLTPLHFAGLNGSIKSAQILMSMDAEVNDISHDKMSPLLLAAASGHNELTQYLLEQGANPNERDFRGYTALHYVAMNRKMTGSISSLLTAGADPNARVLNSDSDHEFKAVPDLPFLISPTRIVPTGVRGATLPAGVTPIYIAAQTRNAKAMRILFDGGADMHLASTESVYYLGGSGRRVNYIAGTTPLMVAAGMDRVADNWIGYPEDLEKQALEAVKMAVELGGDVNATNEYGMTALHGASFINADGIIEFLVKNGADINAKDNFGQNPVSIAKHVIVVGMGDYFDTRPRRSSPETYALLMKLGAIPLEQSGVVAR
ncbi:MAG: ankyrin repeat protein [Gammaproteobacteria bacterium]|jgi:ankyrin repeat protein